MRDRAFMSEEEINKTFSDHIDSLQVSGLPFDEAGLRAEWQDALSNYREGRGQPRWLDL